MEKYAIQRKAELLSIFATYNALKEKGMPEDEILLEMKETRRGLKRKSDELDRIRKNEQSKNKSLKERIKVKNTPISSNNKEKLEQSKEINEQTKNEGT